MIGISICRSGKKGFPCEIDAVNHAIEMMNKPTWMGRKSKAYLCDDCGEYHITGKVFVDGEKCPKCQGVNTKKRGKYARESGEKIQRHWCFSCRACFSVRSPVMVGDVILPSDCRSSQSEAIARNILSGFGVRETARLLGVHNMTVSRIKKQIVIQRGIIYCKCGKPVGHIGFCRFNIERYPARQAYLVSVLGDINRTFGIYIPSRPRYERPDIENERETEIPMIVTRRGMIALDAPVFDGLETSHNFLNGSAHNSYTPAELLMMKEEAWIGIQREQEIERWERFIEDKGTAFQSCDTEAQRFKIKSEIDYFLKSHARQ